MRIIPPLVSLCLTAALLRAHDPSDHDHTHSVAPLLAQIPTLLAQVPSTSNSAQSSPPQSRPFAAFAPKIRVRHDDKFLYVEGDGLPAHGMMTGITA